MRTWLRSGNIHGQPNVAFDDEWDGHPCGPVIEVGETEVGETEVGETRVDDLFSAGDRVAFHMTQTGTYVGGAGKDDRLGTPATLRSAGIVTVVDGVIASGRVIRDRSGLFA